MHILATALRAQQTLGQRQHFVTFIGHGSWLTWEHFVTFIGHGS